MITHIEQKQTQREQTQSKKGLVRSAHFILLDRYEKNSHRFIKKETLVYSYSRTKCIQTECITSFLFDATSLA